MHASGCDRRGRRDRACEGIPRRECSRGERQAPAERQRDVSGELHVVARTQRQAVKAAGLDHIGTDRGLSELEL